MAWALIGPSIENAFILSLNRVSSEIESSRENIYTKRMKMISRQKQISSVLISQLTQLFFPPFVNYSRHFFGYFLTCLLFPFFNGPPISHLPILMVTRFLRLYQKRKSAKKEYPPSLSLSLSHNFSLLHTHVQTYTCKHTHTHTHTYTHARTHTHTHTHIYIYIYSDKYSCTLEKGMNPLIGRISTITVSLKDDFGIQ